MGSHCRQGVSILEWLREVVEGDRLCNSRRRNYRDEIFEVYAFILRPVAVHRDEYVVRAAGNEFTPAFEGGCLRLNTMTAATASNTCFFSSRQSPPYI